MTGKDQVADRIQKQKAAKLAAEILRDMNKQQLTEKITEKNYKKLGYIVKPHSKGG